MGTRPPKSKSCWISTVDECFFHLVNLGVVLCMLGGMLAGIGTYSWLHDPVVPASGIVTAQWLVPSSGSRLGVACITHVELLGFGFGRMARDIRANLTDVGPCFAGAVGLVLDDLCYPRDHPERAQLYCDEQAWGMMIAGWTILFIGLLLFAWVAIAHICSNCGRAATIAPLQA